MTSVFFKRPGAVRHNRHMRYALRHWTAILIIVLVAGWAIFYLPNTPSFAIFELKQAIDARNGNTAASYVDFKNDDRAPLLFIAGGDDNIMPPSVNESNVHHYRNSKAVTEYKEFEGRSHYTLGQPGWEEVADYALGWAVEKADMTVVGG